MIFAHDIFGFFFSMPKLIPEELFERSATARIGTYIIQMPDEQVRQGDKLKQTLILQRVLSQFESLEALIKRLSNFLHGIHDFTSVSVGLF